MALFEYGRQAGLEPAFLAGHSLGEYTAAAAAGVVDVRDGMTLVSERGALMAKAQHERPGTMAAIAGLALEQVTGLCAVASNQGSVSVANVNAPSQIVVSGDLDAVLQLAQLARDAGAENVVMLKVGAAFHTGLMSLVEARLADTVMRLAWTDPTIPIVTNVAASVAVTADAIRDALIEQITRPVDWVGCIGTLRALGVTTFLELGPGRVLTGLARLIDPDIDVFAADSPDKIDRFVARLQARGEPSKPA
jgi:[acyl-carrier-protein] S-malonyltransferase